MLCEKFVASLVWFEVIKVANYRFVKSVIKSLKRRDGQPVTLYKTTTTGTINWEEGSVDGRVTDTKSIAKALILPGRTAKTFNYDLTYIAANKNFTYGGTYDTTTRDIIIDRDDIGDFGIDMNTRVRFNESDYEIKALNDFEESNSVYLTVVKVEGQINES